MDFSKIRSLVGNTPLLCIRYSHRGKIRKAYFKAEWYNFSGSIKDRVALEIFETAFLQGRLKKNDEIAESTSGNMGISLCALGNLLGLKTTVFMPETMSFERKQLLSSYGANLILVKDFHSAFEQLKSYAQTTKCFLSEQFANQSNEKAHSDHTAVEALAQLEKANLCAKGVLAGVGTGGTLMGLSKRVKSKYPFVKTFAVEPYENKLLSTGKSNAPHALQGLADDVIPKLYNKNCVDKVVGVKDCDAFAFANALAKKFGLGVGISSGANLAGAVLSGCDDLLSVFADDNKKYLSVNVETKSELLDETELLSCDIV